MLSARKRIVVFTVILLITLFGYQRYLDNERTSQSQDRINEAESKLWSSIREKSSENFSHLMFQGFVCGFGDKLKPIDEMLSNISQKKSIPPDLIPVVSDFNESAKFLSEAKDIFLRDNGNLNMNEIPIQASIERFVAGVNLKSKELEQGLIKYSHPYFNNLHNVIDEFSVPACALYSASKDSDLFNAEPKPEVDPVPEYTGFDAELQKISEQVYFEQTCDLRASAKNLNADIKNAQLNPVFKSTLLESSKELIYDLGLVIFSPGFRNDFIPPLNETYSIPALKSLREELENLRYKYWKDSSKNYSDSFTTLADKIMSAGQAGCNKKEEQKLD